MTTIPKDFIAFDLETTGFAPPCKIIEIGAIKVINSKITEEFQTFVNPRMLIPPPITSLTGIDQGMVQGAPKIEEILPLFIRFIGELPLAAHNASFDMSFIRYEVGKLGIPLANRVVDTLALSRKYYPRLENHKLNTVARHIGAVNEREHRGLYDAMVVARILLQLSSEGVQAG